TGGLIPEGCGWSNVFSSPHYVFGDSGAGFVRALPVNQDRTGVSSTDHVTLATYNQQRPVAFRMGPDESLYAVMYGAGAVYRFTPADQSGPDCMDGGGGAGGQPGTGGAGQAGQGPTGGSGGSGGAATGGSGGAVTSGAGPGTGGAATGGTGPGPGGSTSGGAPGAGGAATGGSAGSAPGGGDDEGCGCRAAGNDGASTRWFAVFGAAATALFGLRRRRRQR